MTSHDGRPGFFGAYLWEHLWASMWRICNGVVRAVVVGVPLGIAIASWRTFAAVVEPWVNFLRSLPPLAYFVLLIFWFGIGDASKVWLLFGAAFPPITLATIAGVQRVRARPHRRRPLARRRRGPGAAPHRPAVDPARPLRRPPRRHRVRLDDDRRRRDRQRPPGIGGMAWATRSQNRADIAIMCVIVIGITAVAIDQLIKLAERLAVPWRGHA